MSNIILSLIFVAGILYGMMSLIFQLVRKPEKNKNNIGLSIALIIASVTCLLLLM